MNEQPQTQQEKLNQAIEKEVRVLIGDLNIQLIACRQLLEMTHQQPADQTPRPQPVNPMPQPIPPQPERKDPEPPPPRQAGNGSFKEVR